jgi:uncharacterized membrane protein YgcG
MFFVPPRFRPDRLRYVLAAIAFAASSPATADLLVNGSFESPLVPVGGFTNFLAGSTSISGWTVVGIDSALVHESFTQSGIVFQAQSGDQYIDLAGVTSNSQSSGVVQSVPTTIGERYVLRFHVGSAQGGGFFFPSTIDLRIDGGPRTSYTNPATPSNQLAWQEFTVPFVATNASTQIAFAGAARVREHHRRRSGGPCAQRRLREGLCLVNAMHITASVFINDDEPGLHATTRSGSSTWPPSTRPRPLPPQPHRRGQRRRPPQAPDHGPRGRRGDHRRAGSTSGPGSRSSTASSTGGGASGCW